MSLSNGLGNLDRHLTEPRDWAEQRRRELAADERQDRELKCGKYRKGASDEPTT